MKIEEILAEICPQPSADDAEDMLQIALAAGRIVERRNELLSGELAEAKDHLAKLVKRAESGAQPAAPGPRKAAAMAARGAAPRLSPSRAAADGSEEQPAGDEAGG